MGFLYEHLLRAGRTSPDRLAIICGRKEWSFAELELRAREFSRAMAGAGVSPGDRVLLVLHPSPEAIATELACGMIGAAFVPVSPEAPPDRTLAIASTARPALVVREETGATSSRLEDIDAGLALIEDGSLAVVRQMRPPARHSPRRPLTTDPAYIIFTSGSTGTPKGIVMSHRAAVAALVGAAEIGVAPATRVATMAPMQFDFSILDMGLSIACGATLVQTPRLLVFQPDALVDYLSEKRATQIDCVPSVWRAVMRSADYGAKLRDVRTLVYGGEGFSPTEMERVQGELPGVRAVQAFGHSESILCSFAVLDRPPACERGRVTIGHPLANMEMFTVDDEGQALENPEDVGDLCIRGPCLFSGYWNDPAATAQRLIPDPRLPTSNDVVFRSGDLVFQDNERKFYFWGRKDAQVKIAGNRLELEEVEAVLEADPAVTRAIAAVATSSGQPEVVAFVMAAHPQAPPEPRGLRTRCSEQLPHYAVPRRIVLITFIPTTINGKADRRRLLQEHALA